MAKIDNLNDVIIQEVQTMVNQAAEIGAETARGALDLAETDYGRYRMSIGRGNSAGRNDTGSMINDLESMPSNVSSGKIEAKFGWGRGRSKEYYKFQEDGTAKIRAAHSLLDGERAVLNELPRLEKNMKARVSRRMRNK